MNDGRGERPGELLAGAAAREITPDRPQWLDGYGSRTHPSEGVYQPIFARALALRLGAARALLVCAEVLAFDRNRVPTLKERLAAATGTPPEAVVVAATHTHCAPRVCDLVMPGETDPDYIAAFEAACLEAGARAAASLRPATASTSRAQDRLGVNRRLRTDRGVAMRPNPNGPRDADIDTLWLEEPETGRTVASLTVAACHPTCRGGYLVGGDYPGFLCGELERATGGTALFALGCAGDVRPHFTSPDGGFRMAELDEVERAGREMAATVLAERAARRALPAARLVVRRQVVEMPLAEPLPESELRRIADTDPSPLRRRWASELMGAGRATLPRSVPFEFQMLRLAPALEIFFLPGEVVAEYGRWVKSVRENGERRAIVAAYCNGAVGYVPTAKMLSEGGYEATGSHPFYRLPAPYAPDLEARFQRAVLDLIGTEA